MVKTIVRGFVSLGQVVVFIAAIVLGAQYMWSGVEGKSKVKETLPALLIGATCFYLYNTINEFVSSNIIGVINSSDTTAEIASTIWATVSSVVNVVALAGIIATGIRYMISPSNKRADLKKSLFPLVTGMILVYSSVNLITFIVNIAAGIMEQ